MPKRPALQYWDRGQVCNLVKDVRRRMGDAWDWSVPPVRKAMIAQEVLNIVLTASRFQLLPEAAIRELWYESEIEADLAEREE
jgi:hypothetical protein